MTVTVPAEFLPRVRLNEPLARHTTWHVGGPVDVFFTPADRADLGNFLRAIPADVPVHWIGLGSNLLVRDGGIRGVVVSTHGTLDTLALRADGTVYGEAGVACARVAKQCVRWGLGSGEFFAGIPGTLGGALAMNAGAFGGETWRHVVTVETIDRRGEIRVRAAGEYRVSYRHVEPPASGEWFLSATLRFEMRAANDDSAVRALLERRRQTQPIGAWSCGSVFINPPNDHAARLIESAGLKGFRIGDAEVSRKHANFIVNDGAASAADLERLIEHVQDTVERVHGVRLRTEVRVVGEAAACA